MSAFARLLDEIVSENQASATPTYIGAVAEDAAGLVRRFADDWLDLRREIAHLRNGEARDLIAKRITIEHVLVAATRVAPLVNAGLADQYVNLVEQPKLLNHLLVSPHDGDDWSDHVLAEIEALDKEAPLARTGVARWELLFRAAALIQLVISESLSALAENVAADLRK